MLGRMALLAASNSQAAATSLLLDIYSGASAAYSLQLLRTAYTGPVVRVRRSSDSTEQDFTAAQVTDGSLTTFCGAGSGFVRTWYDQSGNGFHATQTTANNQPQIVSSGTVITKGGQPSLKFDGSANSNSFNDRLINASIALAQPITHFIAGSRNSTTQNADVFLDSFNDVGHALYNQGTTEGGHLWTMATNTGSIYTPTPITTNLTLLSVLANTTSSIMRTNGTQRVAGNIGTNGLSGISIGDIRGNPDPISAGAGFYGLTGNISELIIYSGNQSANFSAIETNINSRYSIF